MPLKEEPLNDQSRMPFGKYQGKFMADVPAKWLLWLWEEGGVWQDTHRPIHAYIKQSFSSLEQDCPDYIVTHRPA